MVVPVVIGIFVLTVIVAILGCVSYFQLSSNHYQYMYNNDHLLTSSMQGSVLWLKCPVHVGGGGSVIINTSGCYVDPSPLQADLRTMNGRRGTGQVGHRYYRLLCNIDGWLD